MSSQTEGIAKIEIHLVDILLMLQTKVSSHIDKSFIIMLHETNTIYVV